MSAVMQYDLIHPDKADKTTEVNKVRHVTSTRKEDVEELQNLQRTQEELTSELQQVQLELHKGQCSINAIVGGSHHMVPDWNRRIPVLASVAVGGSDKTLHFMGGRNAASMNRLIQFLAQQQNTEGEIIRNLLHRLSEAAHASIQEEEVPRNIPENNRIKSLVTEVLRLSETGYRDYTHCVMKIGNAHTEVNFFFTHLLAWIQIKILESHSELKEHMPYEVITGSNPKKNSIPSIWRHFNEKLEKAPEQQVHTVRDCMRDFLCRAMPVKVIQESKTVDLRQCALTHLQSRGEYFLKLKDTFMESVQSRYQKKAKAKDNLGEDKEEETSKDTAGKTKVHREPGCSWPADITRKATRAACVALSFVLARLKTTVLKTSEHENLTDLETYLTSFKEASNDWFESIEQDAEVSVVHNFRNCSTYADIRTISAYQIILFWLDTRIMFWAKTTCEYTGGALRWQPPSVPMENAT